MRALQRLSIIVGAICSVAGTCWQHAADIAEKLAAMGANSAPETKRSMPTPPDGAYPGIKLTRDISYGLPSATCSMSSPLRTLLGRAGATLRARGGFVRATRRHRTAVQRQVALWRAATAWSRQHDLSAGAASTWRADHRTWAGGEMVRDNIRPTAAIDAHLSDWSSAGATTCCLRRVQRISQAREADLPARFCFGNAVRSERLPRHGELQGVFR